MEVTELVAADVSGPILTFPDQVSGEPSLPPWLSLEASAGLGSPSGVVPRLLVQPFLRCSEAGNLRSASPEDLLVQVT